MKTGTHTQVPVPMTIVVILTFTIYLEKPVSSLKHLLMRAAWKS